MIRRFTFKEFSLMAGIIVALIILFTFLMKPINLASINFSKKPVPRLTLPDTSTIIEKVTQVLL